MVNEVVCLHLGQAGCRIGQELWEQFCLEHEIKPKGLKDPYAAGSGGGGSFSSGGSSSSSSYSSTFFAEKSSGQHVPRAVFMDTDFKYKQAINASKYRDLFHPDALLSYKQDCRANFCEARTLAREYKILDRTMEQIRKTADECDKLQGVFVFHGLGGGTGSGIGAEMLEVLGDDAGLGAKVEMIQCGIYPSPRFSGTVCEPYNSILHTAQTLDAADLTFALDNENCSRACSLSLGLKPTSFTHINALLAQAVSMATLSLRYDCELSANLPELTANLVPSKPFRYCVLSLSPLCSPKSERSKKGFTIGGDGDVIQDLLKGPNVMCNVGHSLKLNRFLAASLLVRGKMKVVTDGAEGAGGKQPKTKTRQIERDDVRKSIETLQKRKTLNFLPWQNANSWKLGISNAEPKQPKKLAESMAAAPMQSCLIGNTTAVRSLFLGQYRRFLKLFYNKAYVWHFLEANGELEEFYEAKESVRKLLDAYEELLSRSAVAEDPKGKGRLGVVGATTTTKEGDSGRVS